MPTLPASVRKVLDKEKGSGKAPLQIQFPTTTLSKPGATLSKADSRPPPTFSILPDIVKSESTKYIIIAVDLDAPAASFPFLSPILHLVQADLTTQGEPDADGFIKLVTSVKSAVPYGPPGPPPFCGGHRYVFMVWVQPAELTSNQIKSRLGLGENISLRDRIKWDEDGCEEKLGLGEPLGGSYFLV